MRKAAFLLLVIAALAVPSVVLGARLAKGDGTLSVRDGYGYVALTLNHGIVFGRLDSGRITFGTNGDFEDFGTCTFVPSKDDDTIVCKGTDLRFRFTTTKSEDVSVRGKGINVTAVGQGPGRIKGNLDALDVGAWSLNGGVYTDLPLFEKKFTLAAPGVGG